MNILRRIVEFTGGIFFMVWILFLLATGLLKDPTGGIEEQ